MHRLREVWRRLFAVEHSPLIDEYEARIHTRPLTSAVEVSPQAPPHSVETGR